MRDMSNARAVFDQATQVPSSPWRVTAAGQVDGKTPRRTWLGRLLNRREMTTYQRCLAVHIHYAGPRSALS
jgi:hypothetical protein